MLSRMSICGIKSTGPRYGLIRRSMTDLPNYSVILENTREQLQDVNKTLELLETKHSLLFTQIENQNKRDSKWVYLAIGSIVVNSGFDYYNRNETKEEYMKNIELLQEDINKLRTSNSVFENTF